MSALRSRWLKIPALALLMALVGGVMAWLVVGLDVGRSLREQASDSLLPRGNASRQIVVVALDHAFIERGAAEATRAWGGFTQLLADAKAKSIIAEPDEFVAASGAFSQEFLSNYLGGAFRSAGNVVWALPNVQLAEPGASASWPTLRDPIANSQLADAAAATGFGAEAAGSNGDAHTTPLAAEIATGTSSGSRAAAIASVALVAWLRTGHHAPTIRLSDHKVDIGGASIPTGGSGALRIHYVNALIPGGSQVIPALDLIEGRVPLSRLHGKIVMTGVTDPAFTQLLPAPVGMNGRVAPVIVDANALNTLVTREFLRPATSTDTIITAALLAFVAALFALLLPLWLCWVPPLLVAGTYWVYVEARFAHGVVSDPAVPLTAVLFAFLGSTLIRATLEIRRRRRVSSLFSQYVPDTVAKELLDADAAEAAASGQRLDVAVIFADLRGFTPIAAELEPPQVRALLDIYYEVMTDIIRRHDGTVMQFVGDEVFAVFGAPLPHLDNASAALHCAREMLNAETQLRQALDEADLPAVRFGIGLHLGEVIAAHVGTSFRRQYTVIGDTVNVASRLCSQARAGELVFSDAIGGAVGAVSDAEELGPLQLKGVEREILGYRIRTDYEQQSEPPTTAALPN